MFHATETGISSSLMGHLACMQTLPLPFTCLQVLPVQGDLEKDEDIKALLEATIKQFGKLDILVSVFFFHIE